LGFWVNNVVAALVQSGGSGGIAEINAFGMNSVKNLREEPRIGANAVLNIVSHPAGAVHRKMILVGTKADSTGVSQAICFTGGLDLSEDRWSVQQHGPKPDDWDNIPRIMTWHDVQAGVEGAAAQGVY